MLCGHHPQAKRRPDEADDIRTNYFANISDNDALAHDADKTTYTRAFTNAVQVTLYLETIKESIDIFAISVPVNVTALPDTVDRAELLHLSVLGRNLGVGFQYQHGGQSAIVSKPHELRRLVH